MIYYVIFYHNIVQGVSKFCFWFKGPTKSPIPYPETRFYAKKVLDNLMGYLGGNQSFCKEADGGMRKQRAGNDATDHDHTH